ncbi:MAG: hypothetical protein SangKO_099710 [Sandaracinaceae bacterium]
MLPDWAPNVHPLVIHFPIALLFVAALVDAIALVVRETYPWVRTSAVGLYALGALGAAVAFLTGRDASDSVDLPAEALTTLNAHADWALYLVWFAGLYALVRVVALRFDRDQRLIVHLPLAVLGLVGLVLVQQTAERGGQMVYQYGVAVAAASGDAHDGMGMASPSSPDAPPDTSVVARLEVLSGAPAEGQTFSVEPGRPTLAVLPEALGDLEARATLDLSSFTGTAALVHHVQDAQTYDFLALDRPASGEVTLRQGRVENGAETTMDSGTAVLDGPAEIKAYAVGTHFRGYLAGEQLTHPHAHAAPPGRVGLRLDGQGTVRVLVLSATPVE